MPDFKKLIIILGFGSIIGLAIGFMRGIIQYKHGGMLNFFRGTIASMLVAILISFGLDSMALPDTMKAAIIGLCAYVADDILVSIGELALTMRSDPSGFVQKWIPFLYKHKETPK